MPVNIFSRFLSQWSSDPQLLQLVEHWDTVEGLVIQTYRQKKIDPTAAAAYRESRGWLLAHYGEFAAQLRPLWQAALVGGTADHGDPFEYILAIPALEGFLDNWPALQHLPAAREAINQLTISN